MMHRQPDEDIHFSLVKMNLKRGKSVAKLDVFGEVDAEEEMAGITATRGERR